MEKAVPDQLIVQTHESASIAFNANGQASMRIQGPSTAWDCNIHPAKSAHLKIAAWWVALVTGLSIEEAERKIRRFALTKE